MSQWEYKVLQFTKKSFWSSGVDLELLEEKLNARGLAGWELVSMTYRGWPYSTGTLIATLKRAK